ncbi:circadian clock protein KaiA [Pleurocapsa sp. FMAR1]|uniref:circadian clock protein KaiA n=1 Tax=Pleurocapsa sp. FMAR1 TaxID=3040204 RepID=UPI0029C74023|nr:circadian clock protein KaiA [Pleurocapsa sp. FMAR1]
MSDYQDNFCSTEKIRSKLHICLFYTQQQLAKLVIERLNSDRFKVKDLSLSSNLVGFLTDNEQIDCIVLVKDSQSSSALEELWQSRILLPMVIVETEQPANPKLELADDCNFLDDITQACIIYHQAEIHLYPTQLAEINTYINLAITTFLSLSPSSNLNIHKTINEPETEKVHRSLVLQQRRLTEKIQARLEEYLGIYYKRQSSLFYRNLSKQEQEKLDQKLSQSYCQILLEYFNENSEINKLIDEFVDQAFFADISTSQILEIHMKLIDEFSYQLQIEGRNDDILLDYRLPLIDITAHLCEMYRRSIPGGDFSLELLFAVE